MSDGQLEDELPSAGSAVNNNFLLEKFVSSIPGGDFLSIVDGRVDRLFPILSYMSRRKKFMAQLEHVIYSPIGFATSHFLGFFTALWIFAVIVAILGPAEILAMRAGAGRVPTWEWAKGRSLIFISSVLGWALLNASFYYLIGATIAQIV